MMNLKLVEEIQVGAGPERVFKAWTYEPLLMAWWGNDQFRTTAWEGDVRTGGEWSVRFADPAGNTYTARGTYQLVEPPNRLCFSWAPDWDPDPPTLIALDFLPNLKGAVIRLTQEGLASREAFYRNHRAWSETLAMLQRFLLGPRAT